MAKPTQEIRDFDALYQQAQDSLEIYKTQMEEYLSELQERYPGKLDDVYFEMGDLKKVKRAVDKIESAYSGSVERIADLVRGRFVGHSAEQIDILCNELELGNTPFKVEKFKDQFAEPTETLFRAANSQVRLENGHLAEFRIEHSEMLKAAKLTHEPYEKAQNILRKAELEGRQMNDGELKLHTQHMDEARAIHERAAVGTQLDQRLNEKGLNDVNEFRTRIADPQDVTKLPRVAAKLAILTGKAAPVLAAFGVLGVASQIESAKEMLSPEAAEDYEKLAWGSYAVGMADPLVMVSDPMIAEQFEDFANEHGLSKEERKTFNTSIIGSNADVAEQMVDAIAHNLPRRTDDAYPTELNDLITARNEYAEAGQNPLLQGMNPSLNGEFYDAAMEQYVNASEKFHSSLESVIDNPDVLPYLQEGFQEAVYDVLPTKPTGNPEIDRMIAAKAEYEEADDVSVPLAEYLPFYSGDNKRAEKAEQVSEAQQEMIAAFDAAIDSADVTKLATGEAMEKAIVQAQEAITIEPVNTEEVDDVVALHVASSQQAASAKREH